MKKRILFAIPSAILLCNCSISIVSCKNHKIVYKQMEVVSFQPYYTQSGEITTDVEAWQLPQGFTKYNQLVKGAGDYLEDNIDSITYKDENCSRDEVLKGQSFNRLGKNQIIMFEGHGSFDKFYDSDPETHSVMWTGREWDEEDVDPYDRDNYNIIKTWDYNEALTMNLILDDKYVGDLTGSIVYLGNCYSGRDCTFAQAFLQKGAEAVIGNSHAIQVPYNSLVEYTTIKKLGEVNPETNLTYTIYEALEYAKSIYGKDDHEKNPDLQGDASAPILYGNPNFRISEVD